ncbi:MAG: peptidylprolyl isomerase [Aquificaceae bacterium]|nr:peptidyl-prolyl cis-trans isomerase [Aquificaceae bacterium]MDW8422893.1 peptidylprolyl isomerase [Aquificaceae bacterium]
MKLLVFLLVLMELATARVVARIDKETITVDELRQAFNAYWREILHLPIARSTPRDLQEFLVEYVRSKIIQVEAKKMGISLSSWEIEEYLEKNVGSKRLSNVAKELIITEVLSQKIVDRIAKDVDLKEGQITAYYYLNLRDFKLPAQVLLERYSAGDLDSANDAYYNLTRGLPVKEDKKIRVGQPMWYSIQTLPEVVRRQLHPYDIGKATKPIEVGGMYVIFRVADRRGSGIMPLEEAKPIVREKLLREKRQEVFQKWFQEVSKRYSVEFYFGQL